MTQEADMFPVLVGYLKQQGFRILEVNPGRARGKDVVAEKNGRRLVLELKGDTSALDVDLGTAIYQLMRYMNQGEDDLGLALTEKYIGYVNKVTKALAKLGIKVIIVRETSVTQFDMNH